jgi:hypothetical protein
MTLESRNSPIIGILHSRLHNRLDHMLSFIYPAYAMMTLLYETVPANEETRIECLSDLKRNRRIIEDEDAQNARIGSVRTEVAHQWYLKAWDRFPEIGWLHHHLAILACSSTIQLFS